MAEQSYEVLTSAGPSLGANTPVPWDRIGSDVDRYLRANTPGGKKRALEAIQKGIGEYRAEQERKRREEEEKRRKQQQEGQ
jgi:hypothetical protein